MARAFPNVLMLRCDPGLDPGEPRSTHWRSGAASAQCVLRGSLSLAPQDEGLGGRSGMDVALSGRIKSPHAEVRGRRPSLEARTAVGRCIGRVASFEARLRSHLRMRGLGGRTRLARKGKAMISADLTGKNRPRHRRLVGRRACGRRAVREERRRRRHEPPAAGQPRAGRGTKDRRGISNLLMLRCEERSDEPRSTHRRLDAAIGGVRPSRLAEPVLGPAEGRTRGLAPQDEDMGDGPGDGPAAGMAIA
jgi:hypothetical protein